MTDDFQVVQLTGVIEDALTETEPQGKVLQVCGRRHHHNMGDSVVNQRYRRFFYYLVAAALRAYGNRADASSRRHQSRTASASRSACCSSKATCRCCQADGWLTFSMLTAVTLYSGQLVAQSELSVVTTLAPETG